MSDENQDSMDFFKNNRFSNSISVLKHGSPRQSINNYDDLDLKFASRKLSLDQGNVRDVLVKILSRQILASSYNPDQMYTNLTKFLSAGGDMDTFRLKLDEAIVNIIQDKNNCISPNRIAKRLEDLGVKFLRAGYNKTADECFTEAEWQKCYN